MSLNLLAGITAVQLGSGVKAGFCGKLFVDAGADVITIATSAAAATPSPWLDRGKASVVLDWRRAEGADLLSRLFARTDVVVSDLEDEADRAVIDHLAASHPRLVHASLTDLGRRGPFAARPSSDLVVAALSGICSINGEAGRLPLREPGNQTALVAALAVFMGALAALAERSQSGLGQAVEVSALEAMVNVLSPSVLQASYQPGHPQRRESADGFLFDCAHGKVSIIISSQRSWETLLDIWQIVPEPGEAHRFTESARRTNMPAIRAIFAPVLMTKTRRELFEELSLLRVPCGMLMNPGELRADEHLLARGSFEEIAGDTGGTVGPFPGPAFRIAGESPAEARSLESPGGSTERIVESLRTEAHSR